MKRLTMIVCIALLVAAMGAVVGCGGGDGESGASPSQVVEKYLQASFDLDVDAAYELLSSEDQKLLNKEDMKDMVGAELEGFEYDYEIGEETITGDTATVNVKISISDPATGQSEEFEDALNLVKEDGEWKISFGDSL
jgi:hypothetical protein